MASAISNLKNKNKRERGKDYGLSRMSKSLTVLIGVAPFTKSAGSLQHLHSMKFAARAKASWRNGILTRLCSIPACCYDDQPVSVRFKTPGAFGPCIEMWRSEYRRSCGKTKLCNDGARRVCLARASELFVVWRMVSLLDGRRRCC